jgi:hypothetical protein
MNSTKNGTTGKNEKIPKGYRLRISTHKMIKQLQDITKASQDMVITRAVKIYMKQLAAK